MNILRSFKSRFEVAPFNRGTAVAIDANSIECQWRRAKESVDWGDIQRVLLRTTDKGPFDDDVFFVLKTATRNYVIPQQAAVAGQILEHLQQLPNFNNEAVIEAMGCTDNQDFLCWERR